MKNFNTHDDFEELMTYVIKKKAYTLSDKLLEQHQMLMHAATLLREDGLSDKSIKKFSTLYKISEFTALNYMNAAPRYYTIIVPLQERNFVAGTVMANLQETRKAAHTLTDEKERIRALNNNDANYIAYLKQLPTAEAIDWEKMKPQITINMFEPSIVVEQEMSDEDLRREIIELGIVDNKSKIIEYDGNE